MDNKWTEDQTVMGKVKNGLLRIRAEIFIIAVLVVAIYFLPPEARHGLLALFITKAMFVTLGVLYAHASRKFLFPYLNFNDMIVEHHWGGIGFLTVYYGVIIWAFSMGG